MAERTVVTPERETAAPEVGRSPSQPASLASVLSGGPTPHAVLHLQRMVGNAATTALLQRSSLSLDEEAENLISSRYAGDEDLENAYDEDPALKRGAHSDGVAKVQQGLADEGYSMPKSFKNGVPDGRFGAETEKVIKSFQEHYGLDVTGQAGRQTLAKLDQLAGAHRDPTGPVRGPEIPATDEAMGAYVVAGMERANVEATATSGIHYDYNYFAKHKQDPDRYPWDDDWRTGHASEEYFEKLGFMDWRLNQGMSASAGLKVWLAGMTIAECKTTILAVEMDALRAAIGDDAFDARFGTEGEQFPDETRLRIHPRVLGTPLENRLFIQSTDKAWNPGGYGDRNVPVGDRVYFFNHPMYLLKHPGGAWQGENAVYEGRNAEGRQTFSGLGAGGKTEDAMLDEMVGAYNAERTGDDYAWLLREFAADKPEVMNPNRQFLDYELDYMNGLYTRYINRIPRKYREDGGVFPDQVTPEMILNAKAYTLFGTTRKGGFDPIGDFRLDASKVARLRPQP